MSSDLSAIPTLTECISNAARLLRSAELTTDLKQMHRYEGLADSWAHIAAILMAQGMEDSDGA